VLDRGQSSLDEQTGGRREKGGVGVTEDCRLSNREAECPFRRSEGKQNKRECCAGQDSLGLQRTPVGRRVRGLADVDAKV